MDELGTIIVSSVTGAVVAFVGAVLKNALDVRTKIDESLRSSRTPEYKTLWAKTRRLPKWPRADITYGQLDALRREFRDWYFDGGGIYLSRQSQRRYASLQDLLATLDYGDAEKGVEPPEYDAVRERCSALRTSLTDDLVSRRGRSRWL